MQNTLILFASCIVAVAADMAFVWWAKQETHPVWFLATAIVLLNGASILWVYSMRAGIESASAITCYALFTVAGCSLLGYLVFGEALSSVNAVGLFLALVALVLINL